MVLFYFFFKARGDFLDICSSQLLTLHQRVGDALFLVQTSQPIRSNTAIARAKMRQVVVKNVFYLKARTTRLTALFSTKS